MNNDGVDMDFPRRDVYAQDGNDRALMYWLSWTAYPGLVLKLLLRTFMLLALYALAIWLLKIKSASTLANVGAFVTIGLVFAWTTYDFLYLRTVKLFVDRRGVWLSQGLFPWRRGVNGATWDQIGEATYTQSFLSWACKSYTVSVSHRFNGRLEIFMTHVQDGHVAVQTINRLLAARSRAF